MPDDTTREPHVTDDVGTTREWADETGAVPVRLSREQGVSEQVALVPEAEAGDHERLDWPAFDGVLDGSDRVVRYDGSGDVDGLAVVDAAEIDDAEVRYEGTSGPSYEERNVEGKEYGEHEMRGVGASGAATDEEHGDEAMPETRPDRDDATAAALDFQDVGKTVVDEEGTELGIVAQPSGEGGAVHVDVDPGVTERVLSKLGWTGEDDVDYVIPGERILRVTDENVVLASGDVETAGE